jgi:ABC-type multidrug transport system ATPase subunit
MGPSGAGKTTFIDIIAQRKTVGTITGSVLVNGKAYDRTFKRLSG